MQTTLLSLAIALILALLAALLGPYFIDWNAQRAAFEVKAGQLIGLPVRVSGAIDVRLLPSPSLLLNGIEIGKPGDPQALRARALGIEFALPPLLSGKLRAVEMRVVGPDFRLSLARDGRPVVPVAFAGFNVEALSIEALHIDDARVELSHAASGARVVLDKLWLNGEVRALPGPFRGEGAFMLDGGLYGFRLSAARPEANGLRLKFSIDPADRPHVAEGEGLVSLEGGPLRFEGQVGLAERATGSVKADADAWRIGARVKANAASALFEQVELQFGPDDRAMKLSGTAQARFGENARLDAVLSARQLDADRLLAGSDAALRTPRAALAALLSAFGTMRAPVPLQVGIGIDAVTLGGAAVQNVRGDIELADNGLTLSGFELRAPGFTHLQASGRLERNGDTLAFTGPVDVSSVDPRAFAAWLDGKTEAAPLPARPLRARGIVAVGSEGIAVERLRAELDRKAVEGEVSYAFARAGQGARLDARLRADELDLDALMEFAGAAMASPRFERPSDVVLALAMGRVRFAGFEAQDADIRLALNAGGLSVERLTIGDLEGIALDASGSIGMDAQAPRGAVSFDLAGRDAAALAALAVRLAPEAAEPLRNASSVLAPARLKGRIGVEPAGDKGESRATLDLAGQLGAIRLDLGAALTGQWRNPAAAGLSLQGRLQAADVSALLKFAAADRMLLVPKQPGTYTLSVNGRLDADLRIDTRLAAADLDARASGTMRPFAGEASSAVLDVVVGRADLAPLHATATGRAAAPVPVALRTSLKLGSGGARLDNLSARVGGSSVQGRLALAFGEMPRIEGDLRADAIDVGALLSALAGTDLAAGSGQPWPETPFAPVPLPALDGAVSLAAARVVLSPALEATKARTILRFAERQVSADAIEAELAGGRGSGELTFRRGAEGIAMRGRVAMKDIDAARLLPGEGIAGRLAAQLHLEGAGLSPRALIGSLNGRGTLSLDKARIAALDPKAFAAATRSVDQGLPIDVIRIRDVVSRALDAGPLVLNSAEASVTIAAGVLRTESFAARASGADLMLTGSYNFSESSLDARLVLSGAAAGAPAPPEFAVLLRGPALRPQRSLDVSALTGWLALRSVDRQAKRLEAVERGRAADAVSQDADPPEAPPDSAPALPRSRPPRQPAAEPLPPPVEIRPAAGERRNPQRVESTAAPIDIRPRPASPAQPDFPRF